jgi:ubiquinone/menaquinone biosynthesis C-methylase UbiE
MATADSKFEGSIPQFYERYMGPLFFEPYANDLASRLTQLSSGNLLELAAGTGILSRALARSLTSAVSIVSTDLNPAMLDHAAVLSDKRIAFRQADAQQLPFPEQSFDCVVCQFGTMFFPDKVAAYREARRVLKPGGHFLFSVWDRLEYNELSSAAMQAIRHFLGDNPPSFISRTPFGYFDTELIQRHLHEAAFTSSSFETVSLRCHAGSARDSALGLVQGSPLRNELAALGPRLVDKVTDAITTFLTSRFGPGPFDTHMQAHVFRALR